jgi:hypothetical protein
MLSRKAIARYCDLYYKPKIKGNRGPIMKKLKLDKNWESEKKETQRRVWRANR